MASFPALTLMVTACHFLFLADGALLPMSDPMRHGYSTLMQDLSSHPAVQFKIPPSPSETPTFNSSHIKRGNIIQLELFPANILELNGNQGVMVMSAYLKIIWNDTDLTWNSSEYGGVTKVELQASQIWTPLLTVMNEVEQKMIVLDESVTLSLDHTGVIAVAIDKHFRTSCKMDFMYFPFDKQICKITFMNAATSPVTLQHTSGIIENFLREYNSEGEWEVTDLHWETSSVHPRSNLLTAWLDLKRKGDFYALTLIGPMALSAFMNCLVFAIPPNAGEKVSFLISIFLSNTVFTGYLSDIMPHTFQTYMPLLMAYLLGLWLWSALAFCATLFVLHRYHNEQDTYTEGKMYSSNKRTLTTCFKTFFSNIFNKRNKVFNQIQPVLVKNQLHPDESPNTQNNFQHRTVVKDSAEQYCNKTSEESKVEDITSVMADCKHDLPVKDPKSCPNLQTKHFLKSQQNFNAKSLDQMFLFLSVTILISVTVLFFLQMSGKHSFL